MLKARSLSDRYERYSLSQSPLAQRPTQRDLAVLLRETRDDLRRLAAYKEQFIVRRQIETGTRVKKVRQLAYPQGRLRAVHELLKFHLNKVKQPDYLFSPRKGKSQRDNAVQHLGQDQFLSFDLKQFYPSTTDNMVQSWLIYELGMYPDVARLITRLVTIDGVVSFGSPLTPVLCALIHRKMFDRIADLCSSRKLRLSVWVDDVVISGRFVPGELLVSIRDVIREHGLMSHKIKYSCGNRPVFITGIGVVGRNLISPNSLNICIRDLFSEYHNALTTEEKEDCAQRLLSKLGTVRFIAGSDSIRGRKAADQMNTIKQQLLVLREIELQSSRNAVRIEQSGPDDQPPFDL